MKSLFFAPSILFVIAFLLSCEKNEPSEPPITPCKPGKIKSFTYSGNGYEYAYDEQGRILQVQKLDDVWEGVIDFQYNDSSKTAFVVFGGAWSEETNLAFDENWNLIKIEGENPTFFTYDSEGYLIESETYTYEDTILKFHFKYNYTWENGNLVYTTRKSLISGNEGWISKYYYGQEPNSYDLPLVRIFSSHWYDFISHYLPPVKKLVNEKVMGPSTFEHYYEYDDSGDVVSYYMQMENKPPLGKNVFTFYCE